MSIEYGNSPPFSLCIEHVSKHVDHDLIRNSYELHDRVTQVIAKHIVLSRSLYKLNKDISALMDFIILQRHQPRQRDFNKTSLGKFNVFLEKSLYGKQRGNHSGRLLEDMNEMCSWALFTELNGILPTNTQRGARSRLPLYQFTFYGMSIKITDIYNSRTYSYSTFRRSVAPHWITASYNCHFHFVHYPFSFCGGRLLDALNSELTRTFYFARSVYRDSLDYMLCLQLNKQSIKFIDVFSSFVLAEKKKSASAVLSRFVEDGMQMGAYLDKLLYAPPDGLMFIRAMEKWLTL